jgi:hypothetical protein
MSLLNEIVFRAAARTSPGVSDSGEGRIYFDQSSNAFLVSENGGAYVDLATAADVTLQNAYNGGGVGAGRSVNLNAGAIQFTDNNADNNDILQITKNPAAGQSGVGLSITMGPNATGNGITVTSSGTGLAALFSGATISVPGAGTNSERLGASATAAGNNSTALGNGATSSGTSSTAVGQAATTAGFTGAIALGVGATNTAANQLMIGSSTQSITQVVIGNGATNGTPANTTIKATDASAATTAGANITLKGGLGNTTGSGGNSVVQAGNGGATSGTGGSAQILGGAGGASNGNGGDSVATAGSASGTGTGGNVVLTGGLSPSGSGGIVSFQTGATSSLQRLFVPNDGGLEWVGLAAAPSLSAASDARIYFNSSDNKLYVSKNGGAYSEIATGGSVTFQNAYNGSAGSSPFVTETNAGGSISFTNPAASSHEVLTLTQQTAGQNVITASGGDIVLSGGSFVVSSGFGLDTSGAGSLEIGATNATTIDVGNGSTTALNITATTTTITGDLTVNGTVTTINTTNLTVTDPLIYGNNGAGSANSGIAFARQGAPTADAVLLWDEANSRWELGQADTSGGTVVPSNVATYNDLKVLDLLLNGTAVTADAGLTVTATAATLNLAATGANPVNLLTNGSTRWAVDGSGNFVAGTDATYTIGALNATRPTSVYASSSFVAGTTTGASITVGSSTIVATQAMTLSTGNNAAGNGYAWAVNAGNSTGTNGNGGSVALTSGTGNGTGTGGAASLTAGTGGASDGAGGQASLVGGSGGATNGVGGLTLVQGGNGSGTGTGGNVRLDAGVSGSGTGGSVLIRTGNTALTTAVTVLPNNFVGVGTSPTSRLHAFGSSAAKVSTVSTNTTLGDQTFILVDASAGAITITLPTAVGIGDRYYHIKKIDSSSNKITISATGGQTIDGSTSYQLKIGNESVSIVSDNANWWKF